MRFQEKCKPINIYYFILQSRRDALNDEHSNLVCGSWTVEVPKSWKHLRHGVRFTTRERSNRLVHKFRVRELVVLGCEHEERDLLGRGRLNGLLEEAYRSRDGRE